MPAYNFKAKFAELVANGNKPHTIRERRARPTVKGNALYLFTGMRTRKCRLLLSTICTDVTSIEIGKNVMGEDHVLLDGRYLDRAEIEALAKRDGFESAEEFFTFFRTTYGPEVFRGELISWAV